MRLDIERRLLAQTAPDYDKLPLLQKVEVGQGGGKGERENGREGGWRPKTEGRSDTLEAKRSNRPQLKFDYVSTQDSPTNFQFCGHFPPLLQVFREVMLQTRGMEVAKMLWWVWGGKEKDPGGKCPCAC